MYETHQELRPRHRPFEVHQETVDRWLEEPPADLAGDELRERADRLDELLAEQLPQLVALVGDPATMNRIELYAAASELRGEIEATLESRQALSDLKLDATREWLYGTRPYMLWYDDIPRHLRPLTWLARLGDWLGTYLAGRCFDVSGARDKAAAEAEGAR